MKLAEGSFNRTFLLTMLDGFEMVVRIPYPVTVPKLYAVASEVATMRFLRSRGLPISQVYSYSPLPDNPAQTEYIFMEYVRGTNLSDVWFDLEERDIVSVLRQLVQLESRMMSIPFPARPSLYYSHDVEEVTGGKSGILLGGDERFCIGPDARVHMWYRRRSQLEVDKGPYTTVEQALAAPARKEFAYLAHFGRPLPPFQHERRVLYEHKPQPPSDHAVNLERYLLAPSLVPANTVTHQFCIRHPDLQPDNIIISRSRDTNELRVESLLDWQHAAILPLFLHANIPGSMQNYDDPSSQLLVPPSLPANTGEQDEEAKGLYHRWLIHFHYVKATEGYNKSHHAALSNAASVFVAHLAYQAGAPWEGETHALQALLIQAMAIVGGRRAVSNRVRSRGRTHDEGAGRTAAARGRELRGGPAHRRVWRGDVGAQRALQDGAGPRGAAEVEGVDADPGGGGPR